VPTREEVEIKNGKKVTVERKTFPGYVLVEMVLTQESLHVVNAIQGVIKFAGQGWTPQALRQEEVNRLLGIAEPVEESAHCGKSGSATMRSTSDATTRARATSSQSGRVTRSRARA